MPKRSKRLEAKHKEGDGDDEDGKDKEDDLKQKPNAGNGGQTDKYVWHQTLKAADGTCDFDALVMHLAPGYALHLKKHRTIHSARPQKVSVQRMQMHLVDGAVRCRGCLSQHLTTK